MGKKKLTPEQEIELKAKQKQEALERELAEIRKDYATGRLPKNPTRKFGVGDRIMYGAFGSTHVTEVIDDGLIYKLHADFMSQSYGRPVPFIKDLYVAWIDILSYSAAEQEEEREASFLRDKDDVIITYFNNSIDSLMHKVYGAGVDFKPDYQRDLIWTLEQKVALIDSIFKNVDIGKFVFIKHDYSREFFYEILDGKQRLTTILEFYEDRFAYKGKKYSELSFLDRHQFTGHPIVQAEVENLTQKQIYKLFLKLNTSGTPVDPKHLEKVKKLYEEAN